MLRNVRARWLAGAAAALLVLSMTGLAAGATLVDDTTPATLSTFEDLNGNGIDDDCETTVTADAAAATAAMAAADLNADGVISTSEAAHSGWVGGKNCNHGGYVSSVAHGSAGSAGECDAAEPPAATTDEADCSEDAPNADKADDAARAACEAARAAGTTVALTPMTHSELAHSDVVGGKNCNHGGAVSEANKAAKAEKQAAKLAAREAKLAAHAAKTHGKANKNSKHGGQN
jgi:hypothetical protein